MTQEEQRIAIAEACGFRVLSDGITHCLTPCTFTGEYHPDGKLLKKVPNYTTWLNAMHEAEKVLTKEQLGSYLDALCEVCRDRKDGPVTSIGKALLSTAPQRAEAFLKTLGLWQP